MLRVFRRNGRLQLLDPARALAPKAGHRDRYLPEDLMKRSRILSVLTASLLSLSTAAFANVYSFTSLPGATLDGLPVSATAQFTTAPGTITLQLTTIFPIPGASFRPSATFSSRRAGHGWGRSQTPTANLVTIGDDASPLVGNPQWLLTNTSGNNYHLDVLAAPYRPRHVDYRTGTGHERKWLDQR